MTVVIIYQYYHSICVSVDMQLWFVFYFDDVYLIRLGASLSLQYGRFHLSPFANIQSPTTSWFFQPIKMKLAPKCMVKTK